MERTTLIWKIQSADKTVTDKSGKDTAADKSAKNTAADQTGKNTVANQTGKNTAAGQRVTDKSAVQSAAQTVTDKAAAQTVTDKAVADTTLAAVELQDMVSAQENVTQTISENVSVDTQTVTQNTHIGKTAAQSDKTNAQSDKPAAQSVKIDAQSDKTDAHTVKIDAQSVRADTQSGKTGQSDACGAGQGSLPGTCAPLAFPYVPMQDPGPVRYSRMEALETGTLFPGLNLPFKAAIQARTQLNNTALVELMALDFAIQELGLYLTTHADDQEALQLYWSYIQMSKEGRETYQRLYGPLFQTDLTPEDGYVWLNDPWPWD